MPAHVVQQDENSDPSSPVSLQLHAYDVASGAWQQLAASSGGASSISHLAALAVAGERLLALGWSASPAGSKDDYHMQVRATQLHSTGAAARCSCC